MLYLMPHNNHLIQDYFLLCLLAKQVLFLGIFCQIFVQKRVDKFFHPNQNNKLDTMNLFLYYQVSLSIYVLHYIPRLFVYVHLNKYRLSTFHLYQLQFFEDLQLTIFYFYYKLDTKFENILLNLKMLPKYVHNYIAIDIFHVH
ncbi:hypothetical protein ES705_50199 [subsurface metagenome]